MKKIVFMGTPEYATIILEMLLNSKKYSIEALFTQPDKPVGRKKEITPPHIKSFVVENGVDIEIYQPEKFNTQINLEILERINPDFIIVAAYGQILPKDVVDRYICINIHASILPKYRGASPIQEMILNRDKSFGVTCMRMDEGLDSGDILSYRIYNSRGYEFASELFSSLASDGGALLLKTLERFENLKAIKQIDANSLKCKKIKKEDGVVDFSNADILDAKYRAYKIWPGIFLKSTLKIKSLEITKSNKSYKEGEIVDMGEDFADIGCKEGMVRIYDVQPPSKPKMNILSYLRGKRLGRGDTLS